MRERPIPSPRAHRDQEEGYALALGIAATMGVGLLLISRYVAETRDASIWLGGAWIGMVGLVTHMIVSERPRHREIAWGSFGITLVAILAIGWWTGFRETRVNEVVVVATQSASGSEREEALAGSAATPAPTPEPVQLAPSSEPAPLPPPPLATQPPPAGISGGGSGGGGSAGRPEPVREPRPEPRGPVSIATGSFYGVDGHDGTGKAEVVKDGNERTLTFTNFDVDPGPQIDVYLTRNPSDVGDRIELGGLKGTQGNQQYEIPAGANLNDYDTVVLYCVPFTVRVAVAELS